MDRGSPITSDSQQEEIEKVVHACAEACGVGRKMVEKICPASEEQEHRMDHHINTGSSYMLQVVLHCEGDLNQDFLLRVLNAMRFKNHVLRTRLIKHEGLVYQIILKDPLVYLSGVSLHGYLARNVRTPMAYGTPLARYAFIREPHGEAFFVWTGGSLRTEFIPKFEFKILTFYHINQSIAVFLTRGGFNSLSSSFVADFA